MHPLCSIKCRKSHSDNFWRTSSTQEAKERPQTKNSFHQYTANRSGEKVSPAKVPLGRRESRICWVPETHRDPSQDLVPESKSKGEETAGSRGRESSKKFRDPTLLRTCISQWLSSESTPASTADYSTEYYVRTNSVPGRPISAWTSDSFTANPSQPALLWACASALSSSSHEVRYTNQQHGTNVHGKRNEHASFDRGSGTAAPYLSLVCVKCDCPKCKVN